MNDLTDLNDGWGPPAPPSTAAHSAARAALMQRIAGAGAPEPEPRHRHRRGMRFGWLAGAIAATAGLAAAVVLAVAPGTPQPVRSPGGSATSGQQILLAAATVVEGRAANTGTYWHLKTRDTLSGSTATMETWTTQDGKVYSLSPHDGGVLLTERGGGLVVGGVVLTLAQLDRLPTDPAALKQWIADSYSDPSALPPMPGTPVSPVAHPQIPADALPSLVTDALTRLLYLPAPPAVRAAAFRAFASMPDVTDLGPVDGGHALRITFPPPPADKFPGGKLPSGAGEERLVIDTATAQLVSTTNYQGTIRILEAGFTDTMPRIVSAHGK